MNSLLRNDRIPEIDWLNPLKALALLGILLNHLVEIFARGPWFTHPSNDWLDLSARLRDVFPQDFSSPIMSLFQFLGWLGDNCPGVFIMTSGIGLTWAALYRPASKMQFSNFFKRRVIRIFPLYIALHLVLLAASLFIPGSNLSLASPQTLLSLLGLRFTDSLFFYINPSWWFIWLILQIYLVFPLLYKLLNRCGWKWFLIITFLITFVARWYGLLFSDSLYYWMMGIFFGTRLAEFTAGMLIALCLKQLHEKNQTLSKVGQIFFGSVVIYIVGFLSSLFWYGTIISNLLISLGLSGIFFGIWKGLLSKNHIFATATTWIGIEAYSVYLFHQTPMHWTGAFFQDEMHLIAAVMVLILSFPVGWLLDKLVKRSLKMVQSLKPTKPLIVLEWLVITTVAFSLFFIEPKIGSEFNYRVFSILLGFSLVFLGIVEFVLQNRERWFDQFMRWIILFAGIAQLFIVPPQYGKISLLVGFMIAAFSILAFRFKKLRSIAWSIGIGATLIICLLLEFGLKTYHPIEAGKWGEFPALQIHPTRNYSLKPNQVTHLKYNNYDYFVRTNSLGLNSPEIEINKPTPTTLRILVLGDAFSMPEGMTYEESYPALLERQLAKEISTHSVQVINAGVTGYGPVEQYPQLKELGQLLKPDLVIYQFFVNEFEEALFTPEERLRGIGLIKQYESKQANLFASSQLIVHYRRLVNAIIEWNSRKPSFGRYYKSLLYFYRIGDNRYEAEENYYYSPENLDRLKYYLSEMKNICNEIDAKFVIYYVPASVAVSQPNDISYFPLEQDVSDRLVYDLDKPFKELSKITADLKVAAIDLTADLKIYPKQPVYFPESWHWNQHGHQAAAKAIAESLLKNGFIKELVND